MTCRGRKSHASPPESPKMGSWPRGPSPDLWLAPAGSVLIHSSYVILSSSSEHSQNNCFDKSHFLWPTFLKLASRLRNPPDGHSAWRSASCPLQTSARGTTAGAVTSARWPLGRAWHAPVHRGCTWARTSGAARPWTTAGGTWGAARCASSSKPPSSAPATPAGAWARTGRAATVTVTQSKRPSQTCDRTGVLIPELTHWGGHNWQAVLAEAQPPKWLVIWIINNNNDDDDDDDYDELYWECRTQSTIIKCKWNTVHAKWRAEHTKVTKVNHTGVREQNHNKQGNSQIRQIHGGQQ